MKNGVITHQRRNRTLTEQAVSNDQTRLTYAQIASRTGTNVANGRVASYQRHNYWKRGVNRGQFVASGQLRNGHHSVYAPRSKWDDPSRGHPNIHWDVPSSSFQDSASAEQLRGASATFGPL